MNYFLDLDEDEEYKKKKITLYLDPVVHRRTVDKAKREGWKSMSSWFNDACLSFLDEETPY